MSGPRIQPALTASGRTPADTDAASLDAVTAHNARTGLPFGADASDPRRASDPGSGNRLGVVRGIVIGVAISGVMWVGIVALLRLML